MFLYVTVQFCPHKFIKRLLRTGLVHSWGKKGQWDMSKKVLLPPQKDGCSSAEAQQDKTSLSKSKICREYLCKHSHKICCNVVLGKHACLVYLTFHLMLAVTAAERWQNFICLEN